jgi:ligand-binding sensor domain-containing protein/signal transduction histidine kinase
VHYASVPPCHSRLVWPRAARLFILSIVAFAVWLKVPRTEAAPAQAPEYFTRTWSVEDGLPQNAVTAIVQTRDGYLWLGTYSGLARFDGVHFKVFDNDDTPALRSRRVTSLFEDRNGRLWIGHETGELGWYKDGAFHSAEAPSTWKGGKVFAIGSDEDDDLWLANEDCLLVRLRDGLALTPEAGGAMKLPIFVRDSRGVIWIARDGKLSVLKRGKLSPVEFEGQSASSFVQAICPSSDGGLWIAVDGRLRKWRDKQWVEDRGATPWGNVSCSPLLETQSGNLAGGTVDSGLFLMLPNRQSICFNTTNGLPQSWVRSLTEDHEGNLWLGAGSGGLVLVRASKVSSVNPPDRWQGRSVLAANMTGDGAMWIGTEGAGIYRLQNDQWTRMTEADGLANLYVWALSEDSRGQLWAGTWGGGVFMWRDGRFARVPGLEDISAPTPALLHTATGPSWIGTGDGLLRYDAGTITRYGRKEGLQLPDVRAIAQADDGALWFGMSGGGLGRLKDGRLKQFRESDGLANDFIQCLKLDSDGTLWIGTLGGGLNRLRQGHFATVGVAQGLANGVICQIADDGEGSFWMGSHGGIMRVNKVELNRCADGETNAVNCITCGKGEGLPTLECSGGMQPGGCKTPDGRLWFPTSKGLVVINPALVKINELPPPVVIEEVLVDGKPAPLDAGGSTPLRIPPGGPLVEFRYTGLSFAVPENVRFKYRLEGLGSDWLEAGTQRSVRYSYIPPGDYTFHVIACNNDGVWNEKGASLAFTMLPRFWQTWWFRVTAGVAACAGVAGSVLVETRRRMRRKLERLERQRALERERARIARDIHDDLGASLTRITLLSQSARAEHERPAGDSDLDQIYDTARELTRAMDEIVWAVNPQHDSLDSLATYLGRFAQDFLAAAHVRCRLDFPMQLPAWPLTAEVRHNLFLAFKEALNNAVKHAASTEVRVSLSINPLGFSLRVEDHGVGFIMPARAGHANGNGAPESDRADSGNGLVNMRQRLDEIGGLCEIRSVPDEGTLVTFTVPVKLVPA